MRGTVEPTALLTVNAAALASVHEAPGAAPTREAWVKQRGDRFVAIRQLSGGNMGGDGCRRRLTSSYASAARRSRQRTGSAPAPSSSRPRSSAKPRRFSTAWERRCSSGASMRVRSKLEGARVCRIRAAWPAGGGRRAGALAGVPARVRPRQRGRGHRVDGARAGCPGGSRRESPQRALTGSFACSEQHGQDRARLETSQPHRTALAACFKRPEYLKVHQSLSATLQRPAQR